MNVQHVLHLGGGHSIEIGGATWDQTVRSIRDRYDDPITGHFNPHSSSELPMDDLEVLIKFAAQHDELTASQCAEMIMALAESIKRQHP
jgi:hypothetical protein